MEFEKINLLSKKFNREFAVEGYNCKSEAGTVISTNSLKRAFETVKNEMKIKTSYTSDVRTSEKTGKVIYASVDWRITDKDDYDSTFCGEALPIALYSKVEKDHPKTIALNRAMSAGIIAYMQFPGKILTEEYREEDEEEKAVNESATNVKSAMTTLNTNATKKAVTEVPELSSDNELPFNNAEDEELPFADIKPASESANNEVRKENAAASKTETASKPEIKADNSDAGMENELVGMGNFAKVTIKELLSDNSSVAVRFKDFCKKGLIKNENPEKQKIVEYIAKHA